MAKLREGKWKSYYNQFGIKITRSELSTFKALLPKVQQITRKERNKFENIIQPNIKKLSNFRTRSAFLSYLSKMRQIAKGTYLRNEAIRFRKNLIRAINNSEKNRFSQQDIDMLTKKISKMKISEFQKYSERFRWRSVGYVYYEEEPSAGELLSLYGF